MHQTVTKSFTRRLCAVFRYLFTLFFFSLLLISLFLPGYKYVTHVSHLYFTILRQ